MFEFKIYTVEKDSEGKFGPKKGDIRVSFPELNVDYPMQKDSDGRNFYNVPNYTNFKKRCSRLDTLFQGRIFDAVESIRNDCGDCLSTPQMFGPMGFKTIKVIRFEDRIYGEVMRQKTIEGWKNAVFGWDIQVGSKCSFSGLSPICEDNTVYTPFMKENEQSPVIFFHTYEEADTKVKSMYTECQKYADEYIALTNDEAKKKYLKKLEDMISFRSVLFDIIFSLIEEKTEGKKEYCVEVRQSVKK